jgi:ABC-type multidrug transport system fused ATPase/permease subunit
MPFMAVVGNPEVVTENRWLAWGYTTFGFQSTDAFLFVLGLLTLVVIASSNGLSAFNAWVVARFQHGLNHELSHELLRKYLDQSYAYYLSRNTSKLAKNVLSEVSTVANGVVAPLVQFFAQIVVALFILSLLFWVDPFLATVVGLVIAGSYGAVYALVRRRQGKIGRDRVEANSRRFRAASEAFGGIKDVKVLGREASFLADFREPSWVFARTNASNAIVSKVPRYALETVAFGGVLIIVLYLLRAYRDLGQVLPVVTLYAFAAYRLMPAFQLMFGSLARARFNEAALQDLYLDLVGDRMEKQREAVFRARYRGVVGKEGFGGQSREDPEEKAAPAEEIRFEKEIRLEGVGFTYPGSKRPALRDVDLVIPKNATVGLVGQTGSGKTTLADLLLGLFQATEGTLLVDGVPVEGDRLFAWRRRIGYVPQEIFLADTSIRRNIAFGIPGEEIDDDRVLRAAVIAHLDELVESLAEGYHTLVGDRGVRLSGGQRQRIGIARAVYDDPDVLILDEATSALDNVTENAVMDAIRALSGRKTMILVAHRLSTVESCDSIFVLEDGRVVAGGTFQDLIRRHEGFRTMATAAGADRA